MTRLARLGDVAELERVALSAIDIQPGTPYVGLENVDSLGQFINVREVAAGELASTKFAFTPEHLLYGKLRPYLAKIARPSFRGICTTEILPIRPGPKLTRDYLFHFLRLPRMIDLATARCTGANLPRLGPKTLADFEVPLPNLEEQQRIAGFMDVATRVRAQRTDSMELNWNLLTSVFLKMFGDPVVNAGGWKTAPLAEIAAINRGKFTPRPRNDPRYYGGDIPFIQTGDVVASRTYVTTHTQTLNEDGLAVSRRFEPGTIAITIAANIGATAILTYPMCFPDSVVGIVANGDFAVPEFLEVQLRFFRATLESSAPQTAQRNINLETLRPLRVIVPPIGKQVRFKELAEGVRHVAGLLSRHLVETDSLITSLQARAFPFPARSQVS